MCHDLIPLSQLRFSSVDTESQCVRQSEKGQLIYFAHLGNQKVLGDCLMGTEFRLQKKIIAKRKSPTLGNRHQVRTVNDSSLLTRILENFSSAFIYCLFS